MRVKQISVFLENKSGRLADVTKPLGQNGLTFVLYLLRIQLISVFYV